MVEEFIKKVYLRLKEIFTQKENPLYNSFYKNEENGFISFKEHFENDERLKWVYKSNSFSEDDVKNVASEIIRTINRYYYLSKQ